MVRGSQVTIGHVGWPYRPQGLTSAQLNLPFCVATLLMEGDVFVDQFEPSCVDDIDRMALSRKVAVELDPDVTALGGRFRHKVEVDVHLAGGRVLRAVREAPRSSEQAFASEADIVGKFRKLALKTLPEQRVEPLAEAVLGLEDLDDASRIVRLMTP